MLTTLRMAMVFGTLLAITASLAAARSRAPGSPGDADVNDPNVVAAADFAIKAEQAALQASGNKEKLTLVKIVAARTQVVAGMNYFLTLEVKLGDKQTTAEAVVYERAWEKKIQLTSWKFANEKGK